MDVSCSVFDMGASIIRWVLLCRLGCVTPLGWLQRMTQYKSKSSKDKASAGLGLLSYPVLQVRAMFSLQSALGLYAANPPRVTPPSPVQRFSQAADILLYRATRVPVGEDQLQHLELARDIAEAFNGRFGPVFTALPQSVLPQASAQLSAASRIMSLRDGTKKVWMSSSPFRSAVQRLKYSGITALLSPPTDEQE